MFRNSLIRERAMIRKTQPEPVDDLLRVTAPREWMLLVGAAAVLAAVVLWGSAATIERTVSVSGVVLKPGERHEIVAPTSGSVSEFLVSPGDDVEAEQAVARLELSEIAWRHRIAEARINTLEARRGSWGGSAAAWIDFELALARAELAGIEALESAGRTIVSPHAGELTALRVAAGQRAAAGEAIAEVRVGGGTRLEAAGLVEAAQVRDVSEGMEARVVCSVGGTDAAFGAKVLGVADGSRALPSWLSRYGLVSGELPETRLVRLELDSPDARVPDGTPCRLQLILSRQTPLRLLISASGQAG